MAKKPVVLMVLDGYGLNEKTEGNAIAMANTPVMDKLMAEYPFVKGNASGLAVGLPDGQMGNSEVGHMNIGAGRIIYQDLTRITKDIEDGTFFENKVLLQAIENCKKNNSDLHLWGLLSDGGVHSHNSHLYGLLEMAKKNGLENVYVHAFLDGRDTPPASGKDYVQQLEDKMKEIGVGKIASLSGRYYAMDRDNNWDRVKLAYDSLVTGEGVKATDAVKAVEDSYANDKTDEFVLPTVITDENGQPLSLVKDGDSVIFFNFRPDRAREITRAFCDDKFTGFERDFLKLTYVCFKDYDETIPNKLVAFEKEEIKNTVRIYTRKNEDGSYKIAPVHQRPVLLIGPPGIGKTAIMEQVAEECEVGLVAYTITHHTRQSAIGLPFISKHTFDGKEQAVTEYTMSEIVASIYEKRSIWWKRIRSD